MDSKVFLAMLAAGNFIVLILLAAYQKKYTDGAMRYHFFAQFMNAIASVFGLARQYFPFDFFAILNSAPFIISCYFESLALLKLSDAFDSTMRKIYRGILVISLAAQAASVFVVDAIHIRVLIFTTANCVLLIPAAFTLLRIKKRSALHRILSALFILIMSAFVIRVLDSLRLGASLTLFGPSPGEIATIVFLYIYLLIGGVGIPLLAKEKTDANLLHLAHWDDSTGLLNRDGFIDAAMTAIGSAAKNKEGFSAMLVDIDELSEISETEGYVASDSVIMNTVSQLRKVVGGAGFVGRLNEYEFMLFLKGVDRQQVGDIGGSIREAIAKYSSRGVPYSVSIGAAAFDASSSAGLHFALIHAACAKALHSAKKKGRGEMVIAAT